MNKKIILFILGFFILTSSVDLAFGHNRTCMKSSDILRIENSNFSAQNISVGQTIEIQGMVVSTNPNDQISKMWVVVHNNDEFYFLDDIMKLFADNRQGCALAYFDENPNWYFGIENSPSSAFILEGNGAMQFKIELAPLKGGNYFIHPAVLVDGVYHIGVGSTVKVEGMNYPTDGEIFEFYLPFFTSVLVVSTGIVVGFLIKRKKIGSQIN